LPGLIDSHFHIDGDNGLPALYLTHGITSLRDPGQWTEAYDSARKAIRFLCHAFFFVVRISIHPPPAYPKDSYMCAMPKKRDWQSIDSQMKAHPRSKSIFVYRWHSFASPSRLLTRGVCR